MLPQAVTYSTHKPAGFSTDFKRLIIHPQMNLNQSSIRPDHIIKFPLNTDGFIDPYSVFFRVTVSVKNDDVGYGGLILDSPTTTCMIYNMVITQETSNNEVERITNYDLIGTILHDLYSKSVDRSHHAYAGQASHGDTHHRRSVYTAPLLFSYTEFDGMTNSEKWTAHNLGFLPERHPNRKGYKTAASDIGDISIYRLAPGLRYLETGGSFMSYIGGYFRDEMCLGVYHADTDYLFLREDTSGTQVSKKAGYEFWSSSDTAAEPSTFIIPYMYSCLIKKGNFIKSVSEGIVKKTTLLIPLLSAVFGHLIPPDAWKLIPAKALSKLLIEIYMNPYAFFTTGYKNDSSLPTDSYPASAFIERKWTIEDISLEMDLWFYDDRVNNSMMSALQQGIVFNTQGFYFGPEYSVASSAALQGSWLINSNFKSLNSLMMFILDNSYKSYTYARKHFRLSGNITSIQVKAGVNYFPPFPIYGHAGNPTYVDDETADNTNFLCEVHKMTGHFLNQMVTSKINRVNFAINHRPYALNDQYALAQSVCVGHEMRCLGKALYCLNFDKNPWDENVVSGTDTNKMGSMELVIQCDNAGTGNNTNSYTMYLMFWVDQVVTLRNGMISIDR